LLVASSGVMQIFSQSVEYRFSVVDEGTATKLNLETPLNYKNLTLPQATQSNLANANLFLDYAGLSTSLNAQTFTNNISSPDDDFTIRELAYDFSLTENLDITIGKKILKWGTGYAFNPTGVIEPPRSPSDPSDRLNRNEGKNLAAVNFFFGKNSFTFVYVNDSRIESWKVKEGIHEFAFRAYTFLNGIDLSWVLHYKQGDRLEAGANWSYVIGDDLELHGEVLGKKGSSMPYHQILAMENIDTIFNSYPYSSFYTNSGRIFYKLVLGGQFTFENGLNVALEYYRNTEGISTLEWNQWLKFVKFQNNIQQGAVAVLPELTVPSRYNLLWALLTLSPRGTMKDYVFAREYYSSDDWSVEFIQFINAGDASAVFIPTVSFRASQFVSLYGRSTLFTGSRDSEYGALFTKYSVNAGIQFQL